MDQNLTDVVQFGWIKGTISRSLIFSSRLLKNLYVVKQENTSINQSIKSQEKKFKRCNATELFPVKAVDMLCTSDIFTGQLMNRLSLHVSQGMSSLCHMK